MKKNQFFDDLKEGLQAAIEYEGGKLDLRTTEIEIPELPPLISKSKIKSLREETLGVSQPLFARILGVSPAAVKAWEQGNKKPSGSARRLMQFFADPQAFQMISKTQPSNRSLKKRSTRKRSA